MIDETQGSDAQDELDEIRREAAGRAGYIRFRMGDLPAVYTDLMPHSYAAADLIEAERAIRAQYAADTKFGESPWRHVGPPCNLLDFSGVSASDRVWLGLDVSIAVGMPDAVKAGCEDHADVIAARRSAQETPLFKLEVERGDLIEKLSIHNTEPLSSTDANAARARLVELGELLRKLKK